MENNPGWLTIYSSRAQKEIANAWAWYEEQQLDLGKKFIDELNHRLDSIEMNPEQCANRSGNFREAIIRVFPFTIIYRINKRKKIIKINSVFHTSKNPKRKFKL